MMDLTLENLGNGAAAEKWLAELKRVTANIQDPNTDPKAVREIVLTVSIKPDNQRNVGTMKIKTTSKIAPDMSYEIPVFFDAKGNAYQSDPRQLEIPGVADDADTPQNVTNIGGK